MWLILVASGMKKNKVTSSMEGARSEPPKDHESSAAGPWTPDSHVTVFLLCKDVSRNAVSRSLTSLFTSSIQNLTIYCISSEKVTMEAMQAWTHADSRVKYLPSVPRELPTTGYLLVIKAGCILTPFSIAALMEVAQLPKVTVVRSVIEGLRGSLELWDCHWLNAQANRSIAEDEARRLGFERWISAEGTGIHAVDFPEPRVFFRRGAADRHVLELVAFDASSKKYMDRKKIEIDKLKREVMILRKSVGSTKVKQSSVLRRVATKIRNRIRRR